MVKGSPLNQKGEVKMTTFFEAMTTKDALTENLMPTHSTSGSPVLDFFFKMGGTRQLGEDDIVRMFLPAYAEDKELTTKAMFALRNVRGGMGERRAFRLVARWVANNDPQIIKDNLHNIPHFGRWDDVLYVCLGTPVERDALRFIWDALMDGDKLCAKWMPREGKSLDSVAKYLAEKWDISMREYRKLLVRNTQVVENLMCENRWGDINFGNVPSQAFSKYKRAFERHQPVRFNDFLDRVDSGEESIHAGAIFPHEIIRECLYSYEKGHRAIDAQWNSLPDYEAPAGTLVVADVSGSMLGEPMSVSVSLGIYFAERMQGPFKDHLVTFSANPKFFILPSGGVRDKALAVSRMEWGMNTNLEAVFDLILLKATVYNLAPEQMPGTVLIISDMQFDCCVNNGNQSAMEMIRSTYKDSGYDMPDVIFWNVRTSFGVPAKMSEGGVGLLGGFSPSLMKSVMGGVADPISIMLRTLSDPMYDCVVVS